MMGKSSWSHSSGRTSVFQDEDPNRWTSCSKSDDEKSSNQCIRIRNTDSFSNELSAGDPVVGDSACDHNVYRHQLSNASNNCQNSGLFSNNLQGEDSIDLLYYGWPEIETFEDVDKIFRSCDSTFGLDLDKDDELDWFSSAHAIKGSDDSLKTMFVFSDRDREAMNNSLSEHQEDYGLKTSSLIANENGKRLTPAILKKISQKSTPYCSSGTGDYSYSDGSEVISYIDNGSQIQSIVNELKKHKSLKEKGKERPTYNGDSFICTDDMEPVGESNHSLNFQSNFLVETHAKKETRHEIFSQKPIPLPASDDNHPSNLVGPGSSAIKFEDSGLPSVTLRASYESNQMQFMESPNDVSVKNTAVSGNKNKERSHQRRLSSKRKSMAQRANDNSVSATKKVPNVENKVEGESEVKGSDTGFIGELDSSNLHETSRVSSLVDEVSIEARSFRQLQHVVEQLDIRIKFCIRDSLYRLARSSEEKHKCVSQIIADGSGAAVSKQLYFFSNMMLDLEIFLFDMAREKSIGYINMETDTNHIDRSIAHFLFHRPSDPPATVVLDAESVKSCAKVQASNNGRVVAGKLNSQEETTSGNGETT